jgi:two-component system, OmpR family, sensor histidine kinase QseC
MRFAMPALRNSLGLKVLGAYLVGVVLSIVLIALGLMALLTFRAEVLEQRVAWQASKLAQRLNFDAAGNPIGIRAISHGVFDAAGNPVGFRPADQDLNWIYRSFKDELAYRVLDESGRVALDSPAGEPFWSSSGPSALHLERGHFAFERDGVAIHVATEPVQRDGRTWFLQYAVSVRAADLFQIVFALPFVGAGIALFAVILLVVFGACSYLIIRRTFKPLRELSATAAAISPRSLDARLRPEGLPAEVAPLVESFNRALERLQHGYRVQQEFLAATAHELKTPLSLIQLQIELSAPSPDRDALLQDVGHMTRQVQQLLLLAEASEAQNFRFEPVDVMGVAQEAAGFLQRVAEAADVRVELRSGAPRPTWLADRGAFFTLLKNLLENAIQHAPRGSPVCIDTRVESLTVRDFGAGADDEQLSRMFVRFWRGPHRRDQGAGLGLAICREIAVAHGWMLSAERAQPGLRFVLSRPDPRRQSPA